MNKTFVAMVVVAIIAIGGYIYPQVTERFGADAGPDHYNAQAFNGGLTYGFVNATSSSADTYTLTAADLFRQGAYYNTIVFTKVGPSGGGTVASTTWTFPASSTVGAVLPRVGERAELCLTVATSTGSALTIAEGTGWAFKTASSTVTQTATKAAVGGAVSAIIMGGHPLCGMIIRDYLTNLIFQYTPVADAL